LEALTFGAPALFFVLNSYERLEHAATLVAHPHVPPISSSWMLLIFCYAIFIPNTWQRAAVVIAAMALAPALVNLVAYARIPQFAQLVMSEDFRGIITEQALKMSIAAMVGIVGVYTIGALRREAFVAKQLGQYRLKKLIGSGGMGEVWLAEHQMMKRPCAIKVIRAEKAGDPQVLARFEREVRATAKLSHWNSVDIYDYGRTPDGTFYYVMEFLPGHNLGELVSGHGPLPAGRIVYLMRQICDALAEAHGHNLIHRDIKPANIYCAYRGGMFDVAKLLDFGLAKPLTDANSSGLTQEGSITGSPLYMSPEQASSEEVDARSDIYSLGAVMYFMATGKPPFAYENPLKVMIAHASEDPEPPRYVNGDVPAELEEIILRSLEKRPEDRFQTVAELRDALEQVPVDNEWSSRLAADWWNNFGCPKRKALAAEAIELAAV
jgi:serine/threonine-protein kinase